MNWIYYQIAMYYLRKAGKNNGRLWMYYMTKSLRYIERVRKSIKP